ncbi:MAG: glycosyltransferase family 1 protein [Cyanobacteria bacterium J06634_5]
MAITRADEGADEGFCFYQNFIPKHSIHNGFDAHHFRVIKDACRLNTIKENYQLPDQFLLWIGQIYPPKNFGRLLRAFAQVKDQIPHQLVIAGEERWRAKRDLDLVESLGLQDRLYFAGWVSHDDLPAFYNLADLFVFPSLYEGFGIPLLEAMACGCPILTAKVGTPPEVVKEAACLVNPRDVADIARGMQAVLSNVALQETMIEKGLKRVQSFSWKKCAAQTLVVLESLQDTGSKV